MGEWFEAVKRDLTPFADPGVPIQYGRKGRWFSANWTTRRIPRSALFDVDEKGDVAVVLDGVEMPYRAFLASPAMSDMLGLAGMILQAQESPFFVETRARVPGGSEMLALSLLEERIGNGADATNVVFVTGDAGAGKTEVLKQLVHRQAEKYSRGEVDYLFLYVNAQGRALARLDEALATELQDLRATSITYHVIPGLTRNRVLVPVIDGFDELLGVLGYEDAFSSLRRFLDELKGNGSLIASARSTYYQQEFLSRSARINFSGQGLNVDPVEILPWADAEFKRYMDKRYEFERLPTVQYDVFKSKMLSAFGAQQNQSLRSKPFFVAKTADLILGGSEFSDGDLLDQLVDGYVERERTEKLLDRAGSPLLTAGQIRHFVKLVAEEMWATETRSLEGETVRILAELAFPPDSVAVEAHTVVCERAPTMAFFGAASGRAKIEFEHQLFFSFFLGTAIAEAFKGGSGELYAVLTRSVLPEHSADFASQRLREAGTSLGQVSRACADVGKSGIRAAQTRENAGSLVAAMLRVSPAEECRNLDIRNLTFAGESFSELMISQCSFVDVEFRRTDLVGAHFSECAATRVRMHEVIVDPTNTLLDIAGIEPEMGVYGLRVRQGEEIIQIFRPDAIGHVLRECGLPGADDARSLDVDLEVVELLERLLRRFERSNLVWLTDSENRQIASNAKWDGVEKLLVDAGIVIPENSIPHKGTPRKALKRLYLPFQIMMGATGASAVPSDILKFWSALRLRFPADPSQATR